MENSEWILLEYLPGSTKRTRRMANGTSQRCRLPAAPPLLSSLRARAIVGRGGRRCKGFDFLSQCAGMRITRLRIAREECGRRPARGCLISPFREDSCGLRTSLATLDLADMLRHCARVSANGPWPYGRPARTCAYLQKSIASPAGRPWRVGRPPRLAGDFSSGCSASQMWPHYNRVPASRPCMPWHT